MSGRTSVTRSGEQASSEWIVGSRPAPFEVLEPTRFRPPIVVVMDAVSGLLLGVEPLAHGSGLAEAARAIRKVMQAHSRTSGPGAGPRILRVDDPELADALRSRVSSRVAILVAPTPSSNTWPIISTSGMISTAIWSMAASLRR